MMTEEVCVNILQLFIPLFSIFVIFGFAFSINSFKDRIILFFDFDLFGTKTKTAYKNLIGKAQALIEDIEVALIEDIEVQGTINDSISNLLERVYNFLENLRSERKEYPKKDLEKLRTSHFNCLAFVSAMLSLFSITSSVIFSTLIYMKVIPLVSLVSFFLKAMFIGLILSISILIYYIYKDMYCENSEIKRNRILLVFLCVLPISMVLVAACLLFIPIDIIPLNFAALNSSLCITFCSIFYISYYVFYLRRITEVRKKNESKIDNLDKRLIRFSESREDISPIVKESPIVKDIVITLSSSPKK